VRNSLVTGGRLVRLPNLWVWALSLRRGIYWAGRRCAVKSTGIPTRRLKKKESLRVRGGRGFVGDVPGSLLSDDLFGSHAEIGEI